MDSLGGVMSDLVESIARILFETVFSFGNNGSGRGLVQVIGCLGGSVIYAMTAKRVDLENEDWRSLLLGWFLVLGILAGAGELFWVLL